MVKVYDTTHMRIFFLIDYWPLPTGGMESHGYEFKRYYESKGIDSFLTVGFAENITEGIYDKKQKVHVLPKMAIHDSTWLLTFLRDNECGAGDLIFCNSMYWIEIFADIYNTFPDVPIVLRSGGNDIVQAQVPEKGNTLMQRQLFVAKTINAYVKMLLVNSNYTLKRCQALGINEEKMKMVRGGVDVQRFVSLPKTKRLALRKRMKIPLNDIVVLSVSRLVPFKGLQYVLEARALLSQKIPTTHIIVGDGSEREKLLEQVKHLDLSASTQIVGDVSFDTIHKYYQVADIFIHTPVFYITNSGESTYIHTETMGRSICEAQAVGIATIASEVGGIQELIEDERNGLLVPERDPLAIRDALTRLCTSSLLREEIGTCAKSHRETLSWKRVFKEYDSLFATMIK